jgi:dihydroorotase-like cyclic amidohydrolase
VLVKAGRIVGLAGPDESVSAGQIVNATGLHILPGVIDIHCHIRAPAYPHRGTVETETRACAAGGITTVFEMPITNPCCNTPDQVAIRRDHFAASAHVDFGLYAAPSTSRKRRSTPSPPPASSPSRSSPPPRRPGREAEFAGLAWPNEADQYRALCLIAKTGLPVVVHAESAEILAAAPQNDPSDARSHGQSRPPMAEALAVAKLLTMNISAKAKLHIAHVTSAATIQILRRFHGTSDFTAETCPHYLRYTEEDVLRAGVAAKINPPIRHAADRDALWQALADGTITHVTTDHAGFSAPEKAAHASNFLTAPPGHPGTETMLPAMLDAVHAGRITLAQATALLTQNAAQRFNLPDRGHLTPGAKADLIAIDLSGHTNVTPDSLITAAAPIAALSHGETFHGALRRTWLNGQTVWNGTPTGSPSGHFVTPTQKGQQ